MTLHTIMPLELVLQGYDEEMEPTLDVWTRGVKMQVAPVAPGYGRIVRLLECTLYDYLNPALAPGSLIRFDFE
ncbi:YlzJ-like family protein [Paenibacillus sp. LHD-117]|uniref:YlzJ-like family protein n=1 Tax=Paenibacillus sp. LHD-117 TaxID=3071412 RepID=UPI0027DF34C1|nr:YlzJ-like family protein [Paenibacillus sp. LHD-117]MDQ6419196.1 YlzJ-like family protein [Paenibacillus sp. LHD-117]